MQVKADTPKSLGDPVVRTARRAQLNDARVAPLTEYVEQLRARVGGTAAVPDFDPWDGGINAEVLFLLEAPGAKAVETGFVSRNNPDETAKNFFLLNQEAGIARERTVLWNIVPWYIGTGTRIRPANPTDIAQGIGPLPELLTLLPALHAVVLVGQKAGAARRAIAELRPTVRVFDTPHPSPLFINNKPENRGRLLGALKDVASFLGDRGPAV
jgi:uracil-DNA glycosylase